MESNSNNNTGHDNVTRKRKRSQAATPFRAELLDELLGGYSRPEDLIGRDGVLKQLTKALVERAMGAELTHHLGYEKGAPPKEGSSNRRNGTSEKTLGTEQGPVTVALPRDRDGSSSRSWLPSTSGTSRASTTRSCRCTPAG